MKKLFSLILSSVLAVSALTGCSGTSNPTSTDSGESPASTSGGKIIMATNANFPPYEYMQGTKAVGVDVDVANEIAKELGAELVVDSMEFNSIIPAIQSGKADFAASGISITEDREKQVDFSIEYATSKQVILTLPENNITTVEDLSGKIVGVEKGTTADLYLTEEYPDVTIEGYDRYTDAVLEMKNKRIDAIVLDSLPAEVILQQNTDLLICDEVLFTDTYAIVVKKGNAELLETINTVLQRLIDEGKIEEYTQNHLTD